MDFMMKPVGGASLSVNGGQTTYTDVFNLFKSSGIKISSEKDLQKADIDIFRSILLESAMISQSSMSDSCTELSEYSLILDMMHVMGIDDFTTMDLITPDPKKMKKIYFSIYDYLRYRNMVYSNFEELRAKIRENISLNSRISKDLEKQKENYQTLTARKEKEKPLFEERMECLNTYRQELEDEKNKIGEYKIENDDILKDLTNNLETQQQRLKDEIDKLQVELTKQRSLILKSPERKKKRQEELTKEVQRESDNLRRLDEDIGLKNMKISCLVKVRNKTTRLRNWIIEAYQRKEKEELLKKELQELKIKLINLDATQEKLSRELNNLTWEQKNLEDNKSKLQEAISKKEENHKEATRVFHEDFNRKYLKLEEAHRKYSVLCGEKDKVLKEGYWDQFTRDYITFYNGLQESLAVYQKKVMELQNCIEQEIADF